MWWAKRLKSTDNTSAPDKGEVWYGGGVYFSPVSPLKEAKVCYPREVFDVPDWEGRGFNVTLASISWEFLTTRLTTRL